VPVSVLLPDILAPEEGSSLLGIWAKGLLQAGERGDTSVEIFTLGVGEVSVALVSLADLVGSRPTGWAVSALLVIQVKKSLHFLW
jgi:hypothetical protein